MAVLWVSSLSLFSLCLLGLVSRVFACVTPKLKIHLRSYLTRNAGLLASTDLFVTTNVVQSRKGVWKTMSRVNSPITGRPLENNSLMFFFYHFPTAHLRMLPKWQTIIFHRLWKELLRLILIFRTHLDKMWTRSGALLPLSSEKPRSRAYSFLPAAVFESFILSSRSGFQVLLYIYILKHVLHSDVKNRLRNVAWNVFQVVSFILTSEKR